MHPTPSKVPPKNAHNVVKIAKMEGSLRAQIKTTPARSTAIPISNINACFSIGIAPGRINAIMTNTEEKIHKKIVM